MKRRVVVTGLGAVTPIGNTVPEFWKGIREGKVGIGEITRFDTEEYKVKLAAEVRDFKAADRIDPKAAKRMEPFVQYAVAAAKEAFADAGLDMEKEDPFRAGVIVGSGIGSLETVETEYEKILKGNVKRVNPLMVPKMISNMAAGNISIQLGLRGKCTNVVTACASGTHCIGDAFRAIQYDDADIMLAGGAESCICPTGVAGFQALTALTTETDPARASIPFDKDRSGFVLGEGAGVVVLEELGHALKRGAHIYAEVAGYGATGDAFHITSPCEDGSGAAKAMELAMQEGGVKPEQVEYINAHGTATHHNDLYETRAIRAAFGAAADSVVVNSTKSMIGHLLGAAGGVEFVVCVKAVEENYIHQTMGTRETDEECDLNYAIGAPVEKEIHYALTNSLGFGGHNACLLIGKYQGRRKKMEFDQMLQLIDRVSGSNLDSFVYEQNGIKLKLEKKKQKIQVSRETGSVEMIEAEAAERPEAAGGAPEAETKKIASPLVGVFYTAPAEDAEPFVKPGDWVKKGQVVGIVEAMKLMNEITSDYDGVIRKVCAENAEAVEYGQPLFLVEEA